MLISHPEAKVVKKVYFNSLPTSRSGVLFHFFCSPIIMFLWVRRMSSEAPVRCDNRQKITRKKNQSSWQFRDNSEKFHLHVCRGSNSTSFTSFLPTFMLVIHSDPQNEMCEATKFPHLHRFFFFHVVKATLTRQREKKYQLNFNPVCV